MNNKEDSLKQILKQKEEDFSSLVDTNLWEAIQIDVLTAKRNQKIRRAIFWTLSSSVAAILLLALILPWNQQTVGDEFVVNEVSFLETIEQTPALLKITKHLPRITGKCTLYSERKQVSQLPIRVKNQKDTTFFSQDTVSDTKQLQKNVAHETKQQKQPFLEEEWLMGNNEIIPYYPPKKKQLASVALAVGLTAGSYRESPLQTRLYPSYIESLEVGNPNQYSLYTRYDYDLPLNFGFSVRKNISKRFAIETGLNYTYLSHREKSVYFDTPLTSRKIKMHYLGVPLKAIVNVYQRGNFSLYASGGAMGERCLSVTQQYDSEGEKLKLDSPPLQWSVLVGLGIDYKLNKRCSFYIEPDLNYFFEDGGEIQTVRKDKPLNFNVKGGLRITY